MTDLSTWEKVGTFGSKYEIRAKGNQRVLVNMETNEVEYEYEIIFNQASVPTIHSISKWDVHRMHHDY